MASSEPDYGPVFSFSQVEASELDFRRGRERERDRVWYFSVDSEEPEGMGLPRGLEKTVDGALICVTTGPCSGRPIEMLARVWFLISCSLPIVSAQLLPGKGMEEHPFLYCGEWQNRSTSGQTMYIVKGGKIVWSYTNVLKGELGDCTMLSNGNIVFSRQFGASEITPAKRIVWNYEGPPGTEIHTAYPVDARRVLIMQNGNPAKLLVINKGTGSIERELMLETRVPTATHGQFRHIRMTPAGTFLVAHMDLGRVVEYDSDGKEIWSVSAPSAWAAVRLKNGHTLISGNQHGYVREVNSAGETVWEINKDDLNGIPLHTVQEVSRLANGNTLINNWVGNVPQADWPTVVQLIEVTPDKNVVWALRDWTALGPASSTQLLDEPGIAERRELQR